jgi:probable phosphoglycerate mutase
METTVWLLRHAETEGTAKGLYCSRREMAVNCKGLQQERLLAERLQSRRVGAVYASPLSRCVSLAGLIAREHAVEVIEAPELMEMNLGRWDGLRRSEIARRFSVPYAAWQGDPAGNAPDGGESGYSVAARVVPFLLRLGVRHVGRNIVVVSHKAVNRIVLCHFLNVPLSEYRRRIPQGIAAFNELVFSTDGSARVTILNDTSHLAAMPQRMQDAQFDFQARGSSPRRL